MVNALPGEAERTLALSYFTLEHLPEAVFWVRSNGTIFQVNEMACQMTGYSREELTSLRVWDLNDSPVVADFPRFWQRLHAEKTITFEACHRHKSGSTYDVEITGNYFEFEGQEFSCSVVRDIHKRKMQEQLLLIVSEATSGLTGHDFLAEMVRKVAAMFRMQYCFIAECADEAKTRLRTIVFVDGEKVLDNMEYDTAGSACSMLLDGKPFVMPAGVQEQFSGARGIEAYVGQPIISATTGEMLGHIAATHPEPVNEGKNFSAILRIVAARIAAELERMRAQDRLETTNAELRKRLNEIELYNSTVKNLRDQVFWLDKDGKFIRINDAVSNQTGYSSGELETMTVFDLNPTLTVSDWVRHWQEAKKSGREILETEHRNKDGQLYPVEVTNNFIEHEGVEYFCSAVRDIRKRRMEEELLRTISEKTAGVTGEDYFHALAKFVTASLDVRYSMVVECSHGDATKLRMLSYVDRQDVQENIEYDSNGTPCEIVMQGKDFFCMSGLQKSFPKEEGIESWLAVPIFSPSTGKVIGNIAAFDSVPMRSEQNQTAILRIFAARAGAEIDRLEAQRKLEKANIQLKEQLKEIEQLKNQLQAENKYLQEEIKLTYNFDEIVSKSKSFHRILQHIEQVAATDATVLILGESGTGKELLARAVHNISNRSKRPLVKINCAALPANLIESELFGHERGAFTGAMERKIGRFELADGGTVFLDEIGELPIDLQSKLLRVLQEGEFERLGNPKTFRVNVRVIAATNRNLEQAIEKNEFREDLYYRLNVFPILSPPLRDRKEDIPLLVKHFCQKYESKIGKKITSIPSKVMDALLAYAWPGNIRELENLIERAMILSKGSTLEPGDWLPADKMTSHKKMQLKKMEDVERDHIISVLKQTGWKVSGDKGAAKVLGLNATTLEARMKKLGIEREK